MAELSAPILFALTQLALAAMFTAMLRLVLGDVASGALRWRRRWASAAFYGAAASAFLSFGVVIVLLIVRPWGILGTPEA